MTMRLYMWLIIGVCIISQASGQQARSKNVIIVTMDGLRWQEVFGGADSLLTFDTAATYSAKYVQDSFWAADADARRKKLMPFLWTEVATKGVLLGNEHYNNAFENANPYWFSYPGYNEIFTGFPDTAVNSNDKRLNKNETVLEYLNKLPAYKSKIAVFGSWDVFSYIFNAPRSRILVNDGYRELGGPLTEKQRFFNQLQFQMPYIFHAGERLDVATFQIAFEYLKTNKPRIMHFGLGDTDEFAHGGMYDFYLDAAKKSDQWIKMIWDFIESDPFYRGSTTLILTTDHGRGAAEDGKWKHHGQKIPESRQLWMAAIGPSIKQLGEVKVPSDYKQGQIAATIAEILGENYSPAHKPLAALSIIKK